jgi:DNA polymerase-1
VKFLDRFQEVWLIDTEFYPEGGEGGLPVPVCLVGKEFKTGRKISLWQDDLFNLKVCPYDAGPDSITVAYYASAEMGVFLSLGWEFPKWVLDLYTEFRCQTNGYYYANGAGLLGALSWFGESVVSAREKDIFREIILKGAGTYSSEEKNKILNYCASDVNYLEKLLVAMQDRLHEFSLLRGRYMKAAAVIERNGVPIDVPLLRKIQNCWEDLKLHLIGEIDKNFHVFEGMVFKRSKFLDWLEKSEYSWPMLATKQLALDEDSFRGQCQIHPELEPLRQLRFMLSKLRKLNLTIGPDGRNRVILSAFQAKTGRNAPSTTKFIFGPATWIRSLIKPEEGQALAYVDWSAAEFGIAASLSGDKIMQEAYLSGDPYLAFAKLAGAVPDDATKASHGHIRDLFKTCSLAVQYGMGPKSLAARLNVPLYEAIDLLNKHKRLFQGFWHWVEWVKDKAILNKELTTVFGFSYHIVDVKPNLRSIVNYPMQANCAEMLRLACAWAVENQIKVCCPVHDALLVESRNRDIEDVIQATRHIMEMASTKVLGGFKIRTDASVIRYPDRYTDERGIKIWDLIMGFLGEDSGGGVTKLVPLLESSDKTGTPVQYPLCRF